MWERAQSDRGAPAGNQQLICLRPQLINMDNFDPRNGWGFLSNWITVSLPASKYCLELIPPSVARNYLHYICGGGGGGECTCVWREMLCFFSNCNPHRRQLITQFFTAEWRIMWQPPGGGGGGGVDFFWIQSGCFRTQYEAFKLIILH